MAENSNVTISSFVPSAQENSVGVKGALLNSGKMKTKMFNLTAAASYVDFTKFIFLLAQFPRVLKIDDVGATFNGKVTYHDSCAALRECNIKTEPRKLLSKVKGLELVEMNDVETCCGFGGSFAVKYDTISVAMADQKIDNAVATEAEYIISTDMSCLMHLDGRINHNGQKIKVIHLADVLASGY